MADAHEIRQKLFELLGDERFRKFVRAMPRSPQGSRLRYWQQAVWDAFILQNPECQLNYDTMIATFRICELHGQELVQYRLPVRDGCVDYSNEFWETRRRYFPNAALDFISTEGWNIRDVPPMMWVCDRCETIRQEEARRTRSNTGFV
jgi:hypothetical protein